MLVLAPILLGLGEVAHSELLGRKRVKAVSLALLLVLKIRLMCSIVTSIFLYACESWTLTAELQRRTQAMEMRCYQKVLHISYKGHVTHEKVCAKIIKRRKLQWYGHVSRSSGLAKTISQGTVKGGRRQGNRERGGKTTSGNGQAWRSASPKGQWRTGKNGENWLQNHPWCPNDPHSYGIDDDDD